jgi:glutathione peroxidase-family protein
VALSSFKGRVLLIVDTASAWYFGQQGHQMEFHQVPGLA